MPDEILDNHFGDTDHGYGQQHTDQAEQLGTDHHGDDDGRRVQVSTSGDDQRRDEDVVRELHDHEGDTDTGQRFPQGLIGISSQRGQIIEQDEG